MLIITQHGIASRILLAIPTELVECNGTEESVCEDSKPDGLFKASAQAEGNSDTRIGTWERVFVSLPTGSDNSLCYSLLPAMFVEAGVPPARLIYGKPTFRLSRVSS